MPRRNRLRTSTVIGVAVLVAVASFGLGFVASYQPEPTVETAGPIRTTTSDVSVVDTAVTTTTEASQPTTTSAPTTDAPPLATTAPPTVAPTTMPATSSPSPTVPPPPPPPTLAPTTVPVVPTTVLATPGQVEATYPRDSQGRMTLVAGGSSAVIVRNTGGSPVSFTVSGTGAVTVGATGNASGLLAPAEARSVPVIASSTPPDGPGPHATISVFGAAGLVVRIPVVVV